MKHPADFYVIHRTYVLSTRGATWGTLTDGPASRTEATDLILDSFRDYPPTLENMRVWHFSDDTPARDVTEDMILEWECANAPDEDELIEQARCDAADDWVHLMMEAQAEERANG